MAGDGAATTGLSGLPREEALPLLIEQQGGRLYALAKRFCTNSQEAEDLVQETFLQAWRHWQDFEGRSSPATWLYTIAARTCQRFHRRRSGEPDHIASLEELLPMGGGTMPDLPEGADSPLAEQIRREGRECIEEAIAGLPLRFRMPLVLKEIVGLSLREVAGILGLREATVKTRLHRARLRLRQALDEVVPQREGPPPAYSKQVCLDLLRAKQESLDRGAPFPGAEELICERCKAVFATLDLTGEICGQIARGELPEDLHRRVLGELQEAE